MAISLCIRLRSLHGYCWTRPNHTKPPFSRLEKKFEDIKNGLGSSHDVLAKYLTELKMDLNNGTKACDRLKEFLGNDRVVVIMLRSKNARMCT